MMETPNSFFLSSGIGKGYKKLNAFDHALMDAGVGNTNLIRVSSIVPPGCKHIQPMVLPYGCLLPIAYGSLSSDKAGEIISAGVACAIPEDNSHPGVIMEYNGYVSKEKAEKTVIKMATQALEYRNQSIRQIISRVVSYQLKEGDVASVFACVVLWYT